MAQIVKKRMHSAAHAAERGGCATLDSNLRGSLQHGASAQRDRLRDAARYAGGTTGGDSCGAQSEVGTSSPAEATSPTAGTPIEIFAVHLWRDNDYATCKRPEPRADPTPLDQ